MSELLVRAERAADTAAIRKLVAAAFESEAEADLIDAIRASQYYIDEMALVAEWEGEVIGHVMISGATLRSAAGDRAILVLAPLAVAPLHQGTGVGSALVQAATAIADERGEPLVVLEGNPAYYSRFGFEPSYEHGIEMTVPQWAPREAGQMLRLSTYDTSLTGTVAYPPAFDIVAD